MPQDNKKKDQPGTPYLEARREWNERYGNYIVNARNWRIATLIVGIALIFSTIGNMIQAYNEKIAVYYVNTDGTGRVQDIWRADQSTPGPRTEQIRRALQDWVFGARTVYIDRRATKRIVDYTYAMTLPDSAAYQTLSAYHREHNPRRSSATGQYDVAG